MTTLITWVGVDQRGPASLYLASDSRVTWPGAGWWDYGRKLFAARSQPHLLGYCGDVFFPTQVLGQIVEMIDSGLLFEPEAAPDHRLKRILEVLSRSLGSYPAEVAQDFQVLYGTRQGNGTRCSFVLRQVTFQRRSVAAVDVILMPSHSDVIAVLGSGQAAFRHYLSRWQESEVGGTSRSVFSAFADALDDAADRNSGGPPQLVGLYRNGGGRTFGVIWKTKRYFYGTEVAEGPPVETLTWHNELFEICDAKMLLRDPRSQPQPRPRSLDKIER